jgi:hypothetical protein
MVTDVDRYRRHLAAEHVVIVEKAVADIKRGLRSRARAPSPPALFAPEPSRRPESRSPQKATLKTGLVWTCPAPSCTGRSKMLQRIASIPLVVANVSSFNEGPLGFFSPLSHWLTSDFVTLSTNANIAWLIWALSRICLIDSGFRSSATGVRHEISNRRIVALSIAPSS